MIDRSMAVEAALGHVARAAFDVTAWSGMLAAFATATESVSADLVSWSNGQLPQYESWNFDHSDHDVWTNLGGPTASINPIVRGGIACPLYGSVADYEVLPADQRRGSALWQEFYEPYGIPHLCAGKAWTNGAQHLMLTAIRSPSDGPITDAQRAALHRIVRAAGDAAQIAEAIGVEGGRMLAGAFDALDQPAFVLDGFGYVIARTREADCCLVSGVLTLAGRALGSRDAAVRARIEVAISRLTARLPHDPVLTVRIPLGGPTQACLRLARLPRDGLDWGMGARILAIVEPAPRLDGAGLTPAEFAVAQALLEGSRAGVIAEQRGVSPETTRTQIKAIYAKTGVTDHVDFIAKFGRSS